MKKILMDELVDTYEYFFKTVFGFIIKVGFVFGISLMLFNFILPIDDVNTAMSGVLIGFFVINLLGFLSKIFTKES